MNEILAAKKIREAAKNWEDMGKSPEDIANGMDKVYAKDAEDLRKISVLLDSSDLAKAKSAIRNLDTIVRDNVPDDVWKWLFKQGDE